MNKIKYIPLFCLLITVNAYSQCKNGDCNNGKGTYDFGWCVYNGEFKDGKPDGKGVMNYDDYSFTGNFKNGVEDGEGIITYKNGTQESAFYYKGAKQKQDERIASADWKELEGDRIDECVSGNCNTGFGTVQFPSGNKYVGNFVNRKREGKGTFYFNNGDTFEGTFKADLKDNGTYTFSNGYSYTGSFYEDDFHSGQFVTPSGSIAVIKNGAVQAPPKTEVTTADNRLANTENQKTKKYLTQEDMDRIIKANFQSQDQFKEELRHQGAMSKQYRDLEQIKAGTWNGH